MGKKGFGGTKLNVKDVLTPDPPPSTTAPKAWTAGAGKAAMAAPKANSTIASPQPQSAALTGKWAKSGPQGLAATSRSVQAVNTTSTGFAPIPRAVGPPAKLALGSKQKDTGAKLNDDDFVDLCRPQTAADKKAEKVAEAKAAARADAFPEVTTPEEALDALCAAAGNTLKGSSPDVRITSGLGWFLESGLAEAVAAKRHEKVLLAGQRVVAGYAPKGQAQLIQQQLDAYFADQQKKAKPSASELEANGLVDARLYGELALHLPEGDAKIQSIQMRLLRRLTKPSATTLVQQEIADALVALVSKTGSADGAIKFCLDNIGASQESVRRGAGLGVGASIKGVGISGFKELGIMQTLKDILKEEGKTGANRRQGALFCLDSLASHLEHSFEPYAVTSIPLLLQCCSDASRDVQLASREAAKNIVSKMRPAGVRMLVNPILQALSDKGWRTRVSAIELLSAIVSSMSAEGGKRLVAFLPKVIPLLCEAAAESRAEIRNAARSVFEQIGAAVSHVDLKPLVPPLVKALTDPGDSNTTKAVDSLLTAVFTTFLDAPSLALISPVVARGIGMGSPAVRKNSAGIVRTLTNLVPEDLAPFLITLWSPLKATIVDETPEVRAAAASAIGAVAAVLPEDELEWSCFFNGILDGSNDLAELDGAARGLSCVLAVLEDERREEVLDELLGTETGAVQQRLAARAGVLEYLPQAVGASIFCKIMPRILPVLQSGLGDADASVHDACERALSAVCEAVGKVDPQPLTIVCEQSAFTLNPQSRVVGITLAGKLLKKLGISSTSECRERLLVLVVVAQSDESRDVRTAADRWWRQSVEGPPGKTLRNFLPALIRQLKEDFLVDDDRLAGRAGRCGIDIHKRLPSDNVLQDLRDGLILAFDSAETCARRSGCIALGEMLKMKEGQEIMNSQVAASLKELIADPEEVVRAAAAKCNACAPSADIAGSFLDTLCNAETDPAEEDLLGLQELLRTKASSIIPDLLRRAATPPVIAGKVACLSVLANVSASHMQPVVSQIFRVLHGFVLHADSVLRCKAIAAAEAIACQLDESAASEAVSEVLLDFGGAVEGRDAAAALLGAILTSAKPAASDSSTIMKAILPPSVTGSADCTAALMHMHKAFELAVLVGEMSDIHLNLQQCVQGVSADMLAALQPILQHGISAGDDQQKLDAAASYLVLITHAAEGVLSSLAMKLAGPLVRAMTANAEPELVQSLVLAIDGLLLREGGSLKPLAPAIQTALLRYLDEKWPESVHSAAAKALGSLTAHSPKPDVLIKSLCKPPQKAGHLKALDVVMAKLSQPASAEILALVKQYRDS